MKKLLTHCPIGKCTALLLACVLTAYYPTQASYPDSVSSTDYIMPFAQPTVADCGGVTVRGLAGKISVTVSVGDLGYIKIQKYNPYDDWTLCNTFRGEDCAINGVYEQDELDPGSYTVEVKYKGAPACFVTDVIVTEANNGGATDSEVAACPDASPDVTAGVLGDPTAITIPADQERVYAGREVPTLREMFGVNVKVGDIDKFIKNNLTGDIPELFSHARVFQHMNKSYRVNTIRSEEKVFAPPYQHRGDLQLIVGEDNVPVVSSSASGAKRVFYDVATRQLRTEPISSYNDPYINYMNNNYYFIKSVYETFDAPVQVTPVLVPSVFPEPQSEDSVYRFPYGYWTREDWGGTPANIREAARAYALIFARTYAPTEADCAECVTYVDVLEISNESWGYSDATTYHNIVDGFIAGIEEYYAADDANKIKLIPGAFQANHLENDSVPSTGDDESWKDYQGIRIPEDKKCYLNGSNYHPYPNDLADTIDGPYRERLVAYPEKSSSKFLYIKNGWKWNELNMPDGHNNIYVTEYGWDSETPVACGKNTSLNLIGVGESAQGVYLTRSTLMLARFGTYRAQPYELLDEDINPEQEASLCFGYHSSGLWNKNPDGTLGEKVSTKVLRKFVSVLGDKKFSYAVKEEAEEAYAYVMEDANGTPTHLVAWYATDINNQDFSEIKTSTLADVRLDVTIDGQTYRPNTTESWYYLDDQFSGVSPVSVSSAEVYSSSSQTYTLRPVPVVIPISPATVPDEGSCTAYSSSCGVTVKGCSNKIEVTTTAAVKYVKVQRFSPTYQDWWVCDPYGNAGASCATDGVYTTPDTLPAGTYNVEVRTGNSTCNVSNVVVGGSANQRTAEPTKSVLGQDGAAETVRVYPNPSSDHLLIQSPNLTGRLVTINVTDALGKSVQRSVYEQAPDTTLDLDLSQLPSGMYLLHVQVDEQTQISRRIVVE